MNRLTVCTSLLVLACVGVVAQAGELPVQLGVEATSRARIQAAIEGADDVDDYPFLAVKGQQIRFSLKVPRKSTLVAYLAFVTPEGEEVEQAPSSYKKGVVFAERSGVWRFRIRGRAEGLTGAYELRVKHAPPKPETVERDLLTETATFLLEAGPGAHVGFRVTSDDATVQFVRLTDPFGTPVQGVDETVRDTRRGLRLVDFTIPSNHAAGEYAFVFSHDVTGDAPSVKFKPELKLDKLAGRKRRVRLDAAEPVILDAPVGVVAGEEIEVWIANAYDRHRPKDLPEIRVGPVTLANVRDLGDGRFSGTLAAHLPEGAMPLFARTATGQGAQWPTPVIVGLRPFVSAISPTAGSRAGGFETTLTGAGLPRQDRLQITLDGVVANVEILDRSPTSVTFIAPPRVNGTALFGIRDTITELTSPSPAAFEYMPVPVVTRVAPGLTPVLGGDLVTVLGGGFDVDDELSLEREDGTFEELTATTFVDSTAHRFTAPVRAPGPYELVVRSPEGFDNVGDASLTYFQYADVTTDIRLDAQVGGDTYDGWTTALADYDDDGDDDLFVASRGGATVSGTSHTRVLRNDGESGLVDVTADVMPAVTATDDWRADVLVVADFDGSGRPSLFLGTSSTVAPASGASHVRILANEAAPTSGRMFVDRTSDLMAPVRMKSPFSFGDTELTVADNWGALDLFVGDLEQDGGPLELVIVHDEVKNEPNTRCGNYCSSPAGAGAMYHFYWGGTRVFRWDAEARGGLGRFDFDEDAMPRKSGVAVNLSLAPGGTFVGCWLGCEGKFTPFVGQRLAVEDLDGDGRLDVAVATPEVVMKVIDQQGWTEIPSLQIALSHPDPSAGTEFTDVTETLTALGGTFRFERIAAGLPANGLDNDLGLIVVTNTAGDGTGQRVARALRYVETDGEPGFEDVTDTVLPAALLDEQLQATSLHFADLTRDGRHELLMLADAAPGAGLPALRILRASTANDGSLRLVQAHQALLQDVLGAGENLDGTVLAIGDLAGDDLPTFAITRSAPTGAATDTRVIQTVAE